MESVKIAIVGAGIIGVTAAVAVKETFSWCDVVIFSEAFSPDTTGDGSAGLWGPFLCGVEAQDNIVRWGGGTHRWLEGLWKLGLTPETGVQLLPVTRVSSIPGFYETTEWLHLVHGHRRLGETEIAQLNEEHGAKYCDGLEFLTYTSEPTKLLPWLMNKFRSLGGTMRTRKINKLSELAEEGYGIVINCSGLGARELVGDMTVKPIRGQVTRVHAPWSFRVILCDDDDGNYIIPNIDSVILGGTHQENDYDRSVRPLESKFIRQGCARIIPALEASDTIMEWVGLRPVRSTIRLESEICQKGNGEKFTVIHNYGHGGSGVTFSWGCALDVVEILKKILENGPRHQSRL
ncbi:D-aspartate oxidase [Fopius arisanus]|uniref:D-aspartate oxidase n=1 Tax=Fopius arisanus TaxID=64838 RepID=A0A9R1T0Q8_9HYME|nr:PREDICTED: D-aspartate oxidase [Fopius arisanus]